MTPPAPAKPTTIEPAASRWRPRVGRPVAVIVAIAACLLTATACDGSEATAPPTSPGTPATSTPTPSPTPTVRPKPPPPAMPPAASAGFTVSSAEAFARFYLSAREYAALTGETAAMRRWASPACKLCVALADGYERQYKAGGSITGDARLRIDRVNYARLTGTNMADVVMTGHVGRFVDRDSATASPSTYPGGVSTLRLGLIRSGRGWLTFGMAVL